MTIEWLESCGSTSSVLRERTDAPHGLVVAARTQTAGRGQRGNSWEAEAGANLTFSLNLTEITLPASRQFELSMAVALSIADFVQDILRRDGAADEVTVKWPNDIYAGDRKICGILIENSLTGSTITRSIAGIGLNVNQLEFHSDAPNPVSLAQLTGRRYDLEQMLEALCSRLPADIAAAGSDGCRGRYRSRLWHGTGMHRYHEPGGRSFTASVVDVSPAGYLTLSNGRSYAFKEVVQEL